MDSTHNLPNSSFYSFPAYQPSAFAATAPSQNEVELLTANLRNLTLQAVNPANPLPPTPNKLGFGGQAPLLKVRAEITPKPRRSRMTLRRSLKSEGEFAVAQHSAKRHAELWPNNYAEALRAKEEGDGRHLPPSPLHFFTCHPFTSS